MTPQGADDTLRKSAQFKAIRRSVPLPLWRRWNSAVPTLTRFFCPGRCIAVTHPCYKAGMVGVGLVRMQCSIAESGSGERGRAV